MTVSTGAARVDPVLGELGRVDDGLSEMAATAMQRRFLVDQLAFAELPEGRLRPAAATGRTAVAILGLAHSTSAVQHRVTDGVGVRPLAQALVARSVETRSVADLALVVRAAVSGGVTDVTAVLNRLAGALRGIESQPVTVAAWSLSAMADVPWWRYSEPVATRLRDLLVCRAPGAGTASNGPRRPGPSSYAEGLHAVAALARHGRVFGDDEALSVATGWATAILDRQGKYGEWPAAVRRRLGVGSVARYDSMLHVAWLPIAMRELRLSGRPVPAHGVVTARRWVTHNPMLGRPLHAPDGTAIYRSLWMSVPASPSRARRTPDPGVRAQARLDRTWGLDDMGWMLLADGGEAGRDGGRQRSSGD